jgi:hypothetical protein
MFGIPEGLRATHVFVHAKVTRNALPSLRPLALLGTVDFKDEIVTKEHGIGHTVDLKLTTGDREGLANRAETIVVKGTLRYDNGFGTVRDESYCQAYISFENAERGGWVPDCDDAAQFLRERIKEEQQENSNKKE